VSDATPECQSAARLLRDAGRDPRSAADDRAALGSDSPRPIRRHWVRNVLAAGGADVETRGRQLRLVRPEVVRDPARSLVPKPVRVPIRLANVDEFMLLSRADAGA
jgi:hypothetical protein